MRIYIFRSINLVCIDADPPAVKDVHLHVFHVCSFMNTLFISESSNVYTAEGGRERKTFCFSSTVVQILAIGVVEEVSLQSHFSVLLSCRLRFCK